jgi:hypothetical protein
VHSCSTYHIYLADQLSQASINYYEDAGWDRIGSDGIGSDRIGLDRIGLDRIGSDDWIQVLF